MSRTKTVVLTVLALLFGFAVHHAVADGLVTMHGAACKSTRGENTNITYGETGLVVGAARTEDIFCPLTNHWGGGTDWPSQVKTITMYFVTGAPAGNLSCTAIKQSIYGTRIEVQSGTGVGNDANKRLSIPEFTAERSTTKHNYVVKCTLPANTTLSNLQYNTVAVP